MMNFRGLRVVGRFGPMSIAILLLTANLPLAAPAPEPASVRVTDASRPTTCAEEDNVFLPLQGKGIARFRIEATHPPYIDTLRTDSTAPDFRGCDMSGDPAFDFTPRTVTLLETPELALVGHTFARFWRPEKVPVRVTDRTEEGLHLLQLFLKTVRGRVEYLVLYPSDGYWRLKPLPPAALPDSAYGSSFLIGPVEEQGRPLVRLKTIAFEPWTRTFRLEFQAGGSGSLRVAAIDERRAVVDVRFEPPVPDNQPFAALRSMFVSPQVADVAEVSWQAEAGGDWQIRPIGATLDEEVTAVRFRRSEISRHNSSAPDLLFDTFKALPGRR